MFAHYSHLQTSISSSSLDIRACKAKWNGKLWFSWGFNFFCSLTFCGSQNTSMLLSHELPYWLSSCWYSQASIQGWLEVDLLTAFCAPSSSEYCRHYRVGQKSCESAQASAATPGTETPAAGQKEPHTSESTFRKQLLRWLAVHWAWENRQACWASSLQKARKWQNSTWTEW